MQMDYSGDTILKCSNCGCEFRSFFSSIGSAIGCQESCPHCGSVINTPTVIGGMNMNALERASEEPLYRLFGEGGRGGAVFMGPTQLIWWVQSPPLVAVTKSYNRNIDRALTIVDVSFESGLAREQLLLGAAYIAIMSSYEILTDDLLETMQHAGLAKVQSGRLALHRGRMALFDALVLAEDEHVTALRYLYAFRNCLAHNAGIVDQSFLDNINNINLSRGNLAYEVGQPLVLAHQTATSFANSLQVLADRLLRAAQELFDKIT